MEIMEIQHYTRETIKFLFNLTSQIEIKKIHSDKENLKWIYICNYRRLLFIMMMR